MDLDANMVLDAGAASLATAMSCGLSNISLRSNGIGDVALAAVVSAAGPEHDVAIWGNKFGPTAALALQNAGRGGSFDVVSYVVDGEVKVARK